MSARVRPALVLGVAAVTGACNSLDEPPAKPHGIGGSTGMGVGGGTSAGTGAGPGIMIPTLPGDPPCTLPDAEPPVFIEQVVHYNQLFRRELYTWTTDEQIAELREGRVLLTRTEREGLGPGYAFEVINNLASGTLPQSELAAYLASEAFAKARYTWPHPWATRMGWPGESYGNNLVRIVLREDAWLVTVREGMLMVFDADNGVIPSEEALLTPERIAVIFFEKDAASGGPFCGSFAGGGNGYREYIVGNEAMIEEWSIATPEILEKLESDLALLRTFLERIRSCPRTQDPMQWNAEVYCRWRSGGTPSEITAYEGSLAMPSSYYLPAPAEMAALIETLESARFEPDPLIVSPGD